MKTIEAYETVDGQIFDDEDKAKAHEVDLIGQEIDGILRLVLKLDVNRYELLRGFTEAMKDRRELKASIAKLHRYLSFEE